MKTLTNHGNSIDIVAPPQRIAHRVRHGMIIRKTEAGNFIYLGGISLSAWEGACVCVAPDLSLWTEDGKFLGIAQELSPVSTKNAERQRVEDFYSEVLAVPYTISGTPMSKCRRCKKRVPSDETEYHDSWEVLCKACRSEIS